MFINFKKNVITLFCLTVLMVSFSGCVYLIVGGVGAVGGYIVSPDAVEGIAETDEVTIWNTAIDIVSIMGIIVEEHEDGGLMIAKINGTTVTITIVPVSQTAVKLKVRGRKYFIPRISIAQEVFVKIMSNVE